jgi:hypothetical protein
MCPINFIESGLGLFGHGKFTRKSGLFIIQMLPELELSLNFIDIVEEEILHYGEFPDFQISDLEDHE